MPLTPAERTRRSYWKHRAKRQAEALDYWRNHKREVRETRLFREYGFGFEVLFAVHARQGCRCFLCDRPISLRVGSGDPLRAVIDTEGPHTGDPSTFRALLCSTCNRAIDGVPVVLFSETVKRYRRSRPHAQLVASLCA